MSQSAVSSVPLPEFHLWRKIGRRRVPLSFDVEITARCNNNCRHCYINLPAGDRKAKEKELSLEEINGIADEAVSLGVIWCLITGGEPLLRDDFSDIYISLRKKGLLVSVFTNAVLVREEHVRLLSKYPPRDIEVSVYGVTKETYERVTRKPGSFDAFMRGLNLLLEGGIKVRFKAMALRSNVHEMQEIARFCRERTKDYFRFDPLLNLRFDGDPVRNEEIKSERLSPEKIVELERSDPERFQSMERDCDKLIRPEASKIVCDHIIHCGAGRNSFSVSYDGFLRLCSSLWHPDCIYNLREGNLADAWQDFIPRVRDMRSDKEEFLKGCHICPYVNLCLWCPANAYLEVGEMDSSVDYFCKVAYARAESLTKARN